MKFKFASIALCLAPLRAKTDTSDAAELAGITLGANTSTLAGLGKRFELK